MEMVFTVKLGPT